MGIRRKRRKAYREFKSIVETNSLDYDAAINDSSRRVGNYLGEDMEKILEDEFKIKPWLVKDV
jgi:hypothetical protein